MDTDKTELRDKVIDVYRQREYIEVVGWRKNNKRGLEKMKRQAEREGGQLLILSPSDGSAAALSALPLSLPSESKDTASEPNNQEVAQKEAPETGLPEDESSFKGPAISSASGANIIINLDKLARRYEVLCDFDSHNIAINSIVHSLRHHGVNVNTPTSNSLALTAGDVVLILYIVFYQLERRVLLRTFADGNRIG